MSRDLVLCFDGTGAQVHPLANSKVVLTYQALDLSDSRQQIRYYDPSVGTLASSGGWSPFARLLSRTGGLLWDAGEGALSDPAEPLPVPATFWLSIAGTGRGSRTRSTAADGDRRQAQRILGHIKSSG